MAFITYKPHCSQCGAIIDENDVYYEEIFLSIDELEEPYYNNGCRFLRKPDTVIHPIKCEKCGSFFESIRVRLPQKLGEQK